MQPRDEPGPARCSTGRAAPRSRWSRGSRISGQANTKVLVSYCGGSRYVDCVLGPNSPSAASPLSPDEWPGYSQRGRPELSSQPDGDRVPCRSQRADSIRRGPWRLPSCGCPRAPVGAATIQRSRANTSTCNQSSGRQSEPPRSSRSFDGYRPPRCVTNPNTSHNATAPSCPVTILRATGTSLAPPARNPPTPSQLRHHRSGMLCAHSSPGLPCIVVVRVPSHRGLAGIRRPQPPPGV